MLKPLFFKTLFFLFVIFWCNKSFCQNKTLGDLTKVTQNSPEVSALNKFIEAPIDHYNGTADISIPLYEIKYGDISVPIMLRYYTGGIKVNEEASWVGLGWSLTVGGNIAKQQRHLPDDGANGYATRSDIPIIDADYENAHFTHERSCTYLSEDGTTKSFYNSSPMLSAIDGEPDLYLYNFLNRSGKFIFKRHFGTGVFSETFDRSRIKFVKEIIGGVDGIKALTPDGYTCFFGQKEYSYNEYVVEVSPYVYGEAYMGDTRDVSDYKISSIKSPLGKEMNFFYTNQIVAGPTRMVNFSFAQEIKSYTVVQPPSPADNEVTHPCVQSIYIDSVVTKIAKVVFYKSNRLDLSNASKLDSIVVYDQTTGKRFKSFRFTYDYFEGDLSYGDEYGKHSGLNKPEYTTDFRSKRLKLLSVEESGQGYSYVPPYSFTYNSQPLPYKTSFAMDFFGFFNGEDTNTTLLPNASDLNKYYPVPTEFALFQGANRRTDASYLQAGILKEITNPTGGITKLAYESNRFDNVSTGRNNVTISAVDMNVAGYDDPSIEFDITQPGPIQVAYLFMLKQGEFSTAFSNCSASYCDGAYISIDKFDANTSTWNQRHFVPFTGGVLPDPNNRYIKNGSEIYDFELGKYRLNAHYPDGYLAVPSELVVLSSLSHLSAPTNIYSEVFGGGLRVKSVQSYDPVQDQSIQKNYIYRKGKCFNLPIFARGIESFGNYDNPWLCPDFQNGYNVIPYITGAALFSNMLPSYSDSANGSIVGYEQVIEMFSGTENGQTEYNYNIDAKAHSIGFYLSIPPGLPTANDMESGLLLSKITYKKENDSLVKIHSLVNKYEAYDKTLAWGFRPEYTPATISPGSSVDVTSESGWELAYSSCYQCIGNSLYFYPIRMAKMNLISTTDTTFFSNGFVYNNKQNEYDAKGILKKEQIINSDGLVSEVSYNYPLDYTNVNSGWIQKMKERNVIDIPLDVVKKKNNLVTGGSFTEYKFHDDLLTVNKIYNIETPVSKTIVSTVPDGALSADYINKGILEYNSQGNLDFSQPTNGVVTSNIWGYKNTFPIATVANAHRKDIYYNGFEDTNGDSSEGDSKTGRKSHLNGFDLNLSNLTNGLYDLSYWTKSGAGWVLNQSVETVTSGNFRIHLNGQLDDIRFYPKGALMTTYTYDLVIGISSSTDSKNLISYYSYDDIGRLALIYDKDKNIKRSFQYNYAVANHIPPGTGCITPVIHGVSNGSGLSVTVNCTPSSNATACYLLVTDVSTGITVVGDPVDCGTANLTVTLPVKGKTYSFLIKSFGECNPSGVDSNLFEIFIP